MKKIISFFYIVMLISLVSCDTLTKYTVRISVDRHPTLIIVNQTGHPVVVTAPLSSNINRDTSIQFQPTEINGIINVNYIIEQFEFTEQVTMNNEDTTVILMRRPPTVTVINQTGRRITINSPILTDIDNGAKTQFLPPLLAGDFNITYSCGLMELTEQVNMRNQDTTVNLTVGAPTLTIVNNTGAGNNVNIIQFRTPGSVAWIGGNIIISDNELHLAEGAALTGVTTQVLTNNEMLSLWLGNLRLSGNAFDIRLQTTNGIIFQRDNVRITSDMTLTFSINDRR
ncbi:MAG: hypothetical protein FWC03_04040 [Treponema sp.]|nr:hypothetical protein [Treponema sp.]